MMSTISNDLAIVPVVLMIAMSPSMLNAKMPVHIMPMGEEKVSELIAQPNEEVNDATYVAKPEEFQQDYPLGVAYFSEMVIQEIMPIRNKNEKANIVLAASMNSLPDVVKKVYYIKNSYKNNIPHQEPPYIVRLIYHNLGPDKEYLGVLIHENIYKSNERYTNAYKEYEVRLDDETAQYLLDFQANQTKWKNVTNLLYSETTDSNLRPTKFYGD